MKEILQKVIVFFLAVSQAAVAENAAGDEACALQASMGKVATKVLKDYSTEELLQELAKREDSSGTQEGMGQDEVVEGDDVDGEEDDMGTGLVETSENSTKCGKRQWHLIYSRGNVKRNYCFNHMYWKNGFRAFTQLASRNKHILTEKCYDNNR